MSRIPSVLLLAVLLLPARYGQAAKSIAPDLVLWGRDTNTLWKLVYAGKKKGWVKAGSIDLSSHAARRGLPGQGLLPATAGGILVCANKAILEVSADGKLAQVRFKAPPKSSIGDCAHYKGHLLVATENGLVILDRRFKEKGRVVLLKAKHRQVHGILIKDDVAYLLDNFFTPVYVFRVDLRRITTPKILQRITLSGVNTHVSWQWLDHMQRRWAVVRDQSTIHGMSQGVHLYPSGRAAKGEITSQQLFGYNRRKQTLERGLDLRILSVLGDGSRVLTTTYKKGRLRLGQVSLARDRVTIRHLLSLKRGVKWHGMARLARGPAGKFLAVYAAKSIWLISDKKRPQVLSKHAAPGELRGMLLVAR